MANTMGIAVSFSELLSSEISNSNQINSFLEDIQKYTQP
jgi:hypothetical protein